MNKWLLNAADPDPTADAIEDVKTFGDKIWAWFTDADMWANVMFAGIRILVIFILTRIVIKIVGRLIDRSMESESKGGRLLSNNRRITTVGGLLKNVVTVICNFIMIMLILSEFGFQLGPLLASASVAGLAIGFGAQSLVKDVITGFFIIFEDQFAVGDVIQIGTYKGTVEMIGLRTTKLLSTTGEVHIIPNGSIVNITNYSLANALAVVDVPVKMERGLEATLALIGNALQGIEERNPSVIEYPNILGIQSMSTSEFVIRVAANCLPNGRESAERQIQADVKQALEQQSVLEAAKAEAAAKEEAERAAKEQAEQAERSEAVQRDGQTEALRLIKQIAAASEADGSKTQKGEE